MRNRTKDQMMLALIRHGETKANAQRRYLGKTDEPLSERGIRVLQFYKEQGLYPQADYLFASPMKRCVETAGILYPMAKPVLIPEWEEIDFGQFEYRNYEELKNEASYQRWLDSNGALDFPGGESRQAFIARCRIGFQRMYRVLRQAQRESLPDTEKEPVRVSVIAHGGTIMALLSSCGKGSCQKGYFDYQAANGRGYLCRAEVCNPNAETEIWIKEAVEL